MAPVEGIEPPLTVLETAALPLYYTEINFNTLRPMCVSKHTNKVSSVVYLEGKCASILWNFTNCVVATVFPSSRPPTFVV